jgi:hypothetical protein
MMYERSKKLLRNVFAPVLVGIFGVVNLISNPRFQAFHAVDVLQLVASGMCFGVALAALFSIVRPNQI